MMGKTGDIFNLLDSNRPDILIGTETWLDASILDSEFLPPAYKVFCRDRNREGGVLIAL